MAKNGRQNTFCIQYWKVGVPTEQKVLRRINKDGTPVSTKKYNEVLFYDQLKDALEDARYLMDNGFGIKFRKCNRARGESFWLV